MSGKSLIVCCVLFLTAAESLAEGRPRVRRNIAYTGETTLGTAQALDVFSPEKGENCPVVIWIHGGGWRIGDKMSAATKVKPFNDRGIVLVGVNYRLDPSVNYAGQAEDVAKAIRWTYDHAQEIGGDPKQIYLMGHSAGAHLAALVGTDERYLKQQRLDLNHLKGVILLDGAGYDIPQQIKIAVLPRLRQMYLDVFTDSEEVQKAASPMTYVTAGKGIPSFLIFYVSTRLDSRMQSVGLGNKLTEAGVTNEVVPAEHKTHGTINKELGTEGDLPTEKIYEFIK